MLNDSTSQPKVCVVCVLHDEERHLEELPIREVCASLCYVVVRSAIEWGHHECCVEIQKGVVQRAGACDRGGRKKKSKRKSWCVSVLIPPRYRKAAGSFRGPTEKGKSGQTFPLTFLLSFTLSVLWLAPCCLSNLCLSRTFLI